MEIRRSKFHFVDLAGSERAKRTGASGQRFKEVHMVLFCCCWFWPSRTGSKSEPGVMVGAQNSEQLVELLGIREYYLRVVKAGMLCGVQTAGDVYFLWKCGSKALLASHTYLRRPWSATLRVQAVSFFAWSLQPTAHGVARLPVTLL